MNFPDKATQAVLNCLPVCVFWKDKNNLVQWANQALYETTGLSKKQLIGKKCFECWGRKTKCDFCPMAQINTENAVAESLQFKLCEHYDSPKTSGVPKQFRVKLISDPANVDAPDSGYLEACVEYPSNLENDFEMNQYHQKMELLGKISSGAIHDLNNMLNVILWNIDSLRKHIDGGSSNPFYPSKELVETIYEAAMRSSQLTRQVLNVGRSSAADNVRVDLVSLIKQNHRIIKSICGDRIEFSFRSFDNTAFVSGNSDKILQMILNLCINACEAIHSCGSIKTEIETIVFGLSDPNLPDELSSGGYHLIKIQDDGKGMTPEVAERIFDPFFSTKASGKSTGLGLVNCKSEVKRMGGAISVKSVPNSGTTFYVYLPDCKANAERDKISCLKSGVADKNMHMCPHTILEHNIQHTEGRQAETGFDKTILMVDDEEGILLPVKTILQAKGYKVLTAASASKARELMGYFHSKISILITDVILPEENGTELAKCLLKVKPDLKLIFTSGYSKDYMKEQGIDISWAEFLSKPYHSKELVEVLDRLVSFERNHENSYL